MHIERKFIQILLITLFLAAGSLSAQKHTGLQNALAFSAGLYAAEGLGSNFYYGVNYTHSLKGWRYFVEGSFGFSSVSSNLLSTIADFQLFESDNLYTYQFLAGYDFDPLGGMPHLVAGVAGVNQGGQSKFAYVVGIGKRIPLAQFGGAKRLGLRYDIHDQIFKQTLNADHSFTAHNLVLTLGMYYYF